MNVHEALEWALDCLASDDEVIGSIVTYTLNGVEMSRSTAYSDSLAQAKAALAASPRQGEPVDGLDVAWKAAEAALPEGWRIDGLHNSSDGWFAVALAETPVQAYVDTDYRDSPVAALRALAAALSEPAEAGEPADG